MIDGGNVDAKWSGKKMEGEDGLRTVECLRGRLLAERVASRVAKEENEQMGKKLLELEKQLMVEAKSRNRAEKRLKFLLKRLESLNISYVSEDSEYSSLMMEKSDMSSVSSKASSATKQLKEPKTQISSLSKCEIEESLQKEKCPIVSQELEDNQSHSSPIEESLSSAEKSNSEEPCSELESSQNSNNPKTDDFSSSSLRSSMEKEGTSEGNSDQIQDDDDYVDDSLALIPIDVPKASQPTDPLIVGANVREALDALKRAREKLQWSMERRHVIQVCSE